MLEVAFISIGTYDILRVIMTKQRRSGKNRYLGAGLVIYYW